jgi:hypothetical protein
MLHLLQLPTLSLPTRQWNPCERYLSVRNATRQKSSSKRLCKGKPFAHHLTVRVHHENKNFEMVKLPADSASSGADMKKLCPTMPNRWLLFNASSKTLGYQLSQ